MHISLKMSLLLTPIIFISCGHEAKVEALVKKANQNMVFVKGGTFMMGDVGGVFMGKDYERFSNNPKYDPHEETVKDFYISKYETTFGDYKVFAEEKDLPIKYEHEENYAVAAHSWQAAKDYCLWLGEKSGRNYDLPTEVQWEYAARNRGDRVPFATFDANIILGKSVPYEIGKVGRFKANKLGVYDMTSNAMEWTDSWYSKLKKNKVVKGFFISFNPNKTSILTTNTNYTRVKRHLNSRFQGFRCIINP